MSVSAASETSGTLTPGGWLRMLAGGMVTGLLDWRYAAEKNMNTEKERFQPWAAGLAAGIAQQKAIARCIE